MAEDHGAFKTIPAYSRQIPAFYTGEGHRCSHASRLEKRL
jgi:hypothetical protein